jgi:hypothetical protein
MTALGMDRQACGCLRALLATRLDCSGALPPAPQAFRLDPARFLEISLKPPLINHCLKDIPISEGTTPQPIEHTRGTPTALCDCQ